VHLPALEYRCRSVIGGAEVGSLLTRVEKATGEERPAAALISFAHKLRRPQPLGRRRSKTAKSQSKRRGQHSDPDGMPLGADCRTAWEEKRSDAARSGKSSPDACIMTSRPGSMPIWTPQPGSHTYSRMAQAYKEARARVENVPSVRAYEAVARETETPETPEELPEEKRSSLQTPPICDETSSTTSARDSPVEFRQQRRKQEVVSGEFDPVINNYSHTAADIQVDDCQIPWTEDELRAVFFKFGDAEEREVRTEELYSLLRYLGARPNQEEVQELIRQQTWYASLDWFEFLEFIRRFREHDLAQLRIQFAEADTDGSGSLDCREISGLLTQSGFPPTPEVLQEAMQTVDDDGSGAVSFSEFEALRDYLRATRGFLKAEAEEMKRLFLRVSRGAEKLISDEIWRISSYMGYQMCQQEIRNIVKEVDKDGSNYITFDELLEIIRGIREGEREKLLKVIGQFNLESFKRGTLRTTLTAIRTPERHATIYQYPKPRAEGSIARSSLAVPGRNSVRRFTRQESKKDLKVVMPSTLDIHDIGAAFALLGYFVSPEIISQILNNQLRGHIHPDHLTAEELMCFLDAYRLSEGFTNDELEHLNHCFKQEQRSSIAGCNDEALDALELGRVLRGFGISRTLQQVQRLIEDIDFDGSGEVEFHEFTKMMRQLFHEEAKQRREIFDSLDIVGLGTIQIDQIEVALKMIMDVVPDKNMIETAMARSVGNGLEMLGIIEFERFFGQYRRCLVDSVQEHAGFVPSEVEILREIFKLHDGNQNGVLEALELRTLIDKHMPEAGQSVQGKQQILQFIEEVSPETDGRIDFPSFLWLVRKCHDLRDERDIVHEAAVVKSCGYSAEEVEGLRQLFSSHIDWAGELQLEAMANILKQLVEIREQDYLDLEMLLKELNPVKRAVLRFPQFLKFMRKLTDDNLFGVNEAADRTLLSQQQRKKDRTRSITGNAARRGGVGPAVLQATLKLKDGEKASLADISEDGDARPRSSRFGSTRFARPMRRDMGFQIREAM